MPIFESDSPKAQPAPAKADAGDFRPRKREGAVGPSDVESFDPVKIPPAVKSSINAKISEMVRRSKGPDETMFTLREFWVGVRDFFLGLPSLVKSVFRRPAEDDDDDEEEEEVRQDSGQDGQAKPQPSGRSHRGGRGRNRRGGRNRHSGGQSRGPDEN
jgi:hypothetical protein